MEPALEVEDLSVAFGAFSVFKELTFSISRGRSLAVIGPNGSGKTVLFKALIGSIPFVGRVRWAAGTRIGYVPQKTDIDRDLPITGRDVLVAKKTVTRAADDVGSTLQLVGLEGGISAKPIGVLSGGQFQRLLLAVALVGRPNVLLLDEPTASVDEPGQ